LTLLLDTNVISAILRDRPETVRKRFRAAVGRGEMLVLSTIVLHELHYGARHSSNPGQNLTRIRTLIDDLSSIVEFTAEDAEISGDLRAYLAARGELIGPYDILIAAQALRIRATLVTGNVREFSRVPHLNLEDWTQD